MRYIRRALRVLLIATLAVFAVLLAVIVERAVRVASSLPQTDGEMAVAGPDGPIEIIRDENGVPHVYGGTDGDVYFGLGVAHAQDRYWQMDMLRRVAEGRMAEIFGGIEAVVATDVYMRTLGLARHARASYAGLKPETRAILEAYTAGVNAVVAARGSRIAPEYALTFTTPQPWVPEASLMVLQWLSIGLSENMSRETGRQKLINEIGLEAAKPLLPPFAVDSPIALAEMEGEGLPLGGGGSNNWVVSALRSATGAPLLANDPHLEFTVPSLWYLAHLAFPDQNVIGGTVPGFPSVILGRNDTLAWGMTNTGTDVQDLYVLTLAPDAPDAYLFDGAARAFETREEIVKVRFGAPRTITVRRSVHGPVLPERTARKVLPDPKTQALALAWTTLTDSDTTADAALAAHRAPTPDALEAAMRDYVAPMQNIVFAHRDGTTGYIARAAVPIRAPDHPTMGRWPTPGDTSATLWQGFVPIEALPTLIDPPSGLIVTANARVVPESYPYFLTDEWDPGFRARRLEGALRGADTVSVAQSIALQLDDLSLFAVDVLPYFLDARVETPRAQALLDALAGWDGEMRADAKEPLIFYVWVREFVRLLLADDLNDTEAPGEAFEAYFSPSGRLLKRIAAGEPEVTPFCDIKSTSESETCLQILTQSLDIARDYLDTTYGTDMAGWRWGDVHRAHFTHVPFGQFPVIRDVFDLETELAGGPYTPNQGAVSFTAETPFRARHGAGYRAIYDFADLDRSLYVQATGQSGNPLSPHYSDLMSLWSRGRYLTMTTTRSEIEAAAADRLTITPGR